MDGIPGGISSYCCKRHIRLSDEKMRGNHTAEAVNLKKFLTAVLTILSITHTIRFCHRSRGGVD